MDVTFCFPSTGQKSSVCAFLDELLSPFTPVMWDPHLTAMLLCLDVVVLISQKGAQNDLFVYYIFLSLHSFCTGVRFSVACWWCILVSLLNQQFFVVRNDFPSPQQTGK